MTVSSLTSRNRQVVATTTEAALRAGRQLERNTAFYPVDAVSVGEARYLVHFHKVGARTCRTCTSGQPYWSGNTTKAAIDRRQGDTK